MAMTVFVGRPCSVRQTWWTYWETAFAGSSACALGTPTPPATSPAASRRDGKAVDTMSPSHGRSPLRGRLRPPAVKLKLDTQGLIGRQCPRTGGSHEVFTFSLCCSDGRNHRARGHRFRSDTSRPTDLQPEGHRDRRQDP